MNPQIYTALMLAREYGHEWAFASSLDYNSNLTAEEITSAVRKARHPDVMPGIESPTWDDAGNIIHTTGTGRLRWTITPDGEVTIKVSRPDGDVLTALIPAINLPPAVRLQRVNPQISLHHRHVCAMMVALVAVLGVPAATFALLSAQIRSAPD